ncbi:MAG TPA: hypothetical protein VE130_16420 [Nitrososphaeraceae archaeon]|nr:hypothetical protein [Nitrososphaeraceae archaeon]
MSIPLVVAISTSLLAYSITLGLSGHYFFLNEVTAQQDFGSRANTGSPTEECPPNQHRVGSTNQCEWDNCGSATPPMYRNTQTGRCVSDCSELGEFWVGQGNVCVLGEARETIPSQEEGNIIETIQNDTSIEISSENETSTPSILAQSVAANASTNNLSSNMSSTPSTIAQTVAGLGGEPQLPYACFSNTFTCYCDGTEDCNRLTSSGECKEEVRAVEGEPGLGQCDWNVVS